MRLPAVSRRPTSGGRLVPGAGRGRQRHAGRRAPPTELFFSEYIGARAHKRQSHGTGAHQPGRRATTCRCLQRQRHGGSRSTSRAASTPGRYVRRPESANATILARPTRRTVGWFNRDDAVVLRKARPSSTSSVRSASIPGRSGHGSPAPRTTRCAASRRSARRPERATPSTRPRSGRFARTLGRPRLPRRHLRRAGVRAGRHLDLPGDGAMDVPADARLTVTFSEP